MTIIDAPRTTDLPGSDARTHLRRSDAEARIRTRLRPLRVATFLQGIAPWVPVEKLFMHQIGFSPATVALTAAGAAAVVPIMEIPSGILADRWSRRGVLILAGLAGALSLVVGALSRNIAAYVVSALILGVYFAMQSGTVDAIVYDTVLEETGGSDGFERHFGGLHVLNSVALVGSALAGGLIAALASPRAAYLISIPSAVLAVVLLLRFREPRLHRPCEASSLAGHLRETVRDVTRQPGLLPVVAAMALGSMLMQMLFEFGSLWLVALGASAVVFGPFTAGLTGSLGAGGLLAGRLRLDRTATAGAAVAVMIGCGVVLTVSHDLVAIAAAQIVLALLLVAAGIHLTRRLHDAVGSAGRTAVASGVSTLSWLAFLPCAMLFALVSHRYGISATGWIVTGLIAVFGLALLRLVTPGQRADRRRH